MNSGGEIQHGGRGRMLQLVAGELERAPGELQPRPARRGGEYAGLQPCARCAAGAPRFLAGTDARGELDGHHSERGERGWWRRVPRGQRRERECSE